jgi:hypothetical protein
MEWVSAGWIVLREKRKQAFIPNTDIRQNKAIQFKRLLVCILIPATILTGSRTLLVIITIKGETKIVLSLRRNRYRLCSA